MEKKGKTTRLLKGQKSSLTFLGQMVREEYRPLIAEADDAQVISDLFVCAYDQIPVQRLRDALHTDDPHTALVDIRRQYLQGIHKEQKKYDKEKGEKDTEMTVPSSNLKDEIQELLNMVMSPGKFSGDQMDYLLTCIEDGVNPAIIREIACPDYPVDVIKKLKNIKERRKSNQEGGD